MDPWRPSAERDLGSCGMTGNKHLWGHGGAPAYPMGPHLLFPTVLQGSSTLPDLQMRTLGSEQLFVQSTWNVSELSKYPLLAEWRESWDFHMVLSGQEQEEESAWMGVG